MGAMANAFNPYPPREWQPVAEQLRELLTKDEYEAAGASTPNAHFTSREVIVAMWQAMRRFGLSAGAQILEPSMGVGHFFGLMPDDFLPGSRRTGVELDSITARIAKRLYPDATIFAKGFEETPLPEDPLCPRIHRRPRRRVCHWNSNLEHHGRDVHDAPLPWLRPWLGGQPA
jgi:hypothetical protein